VGYEKHQLFCHYFYNTLPILIEIDTHEIDNVAHWAAENNLKLNVFKTSETVFQNSKRRTAVTLPPKLPGISGEQSLKILGVTITSHLSASDHLRKVISESAQSLYALRVLRHHGMTEAGLHTVFLAVVYCVAADIRITSVERIHYRDRPPTC